MLPNRTSLPPCEVQGEMCTACPFKTSPNFHSRKTASWSIKDGKLSRGGQAGRRRVNTGGDGYGRKRRRWEFLKGEAGEIEREIIRNNAFKYFSRNRKWLREEAKKKLGAGAGNSWYGSREVWKSLPSISTPILK